MAVYLSKQDFDNEQDATPYRSNKLRELAFGDCPHVGIDENCSNISTPSNLCLEILNKLPNLNNKNICILFNPEFLILIHDKYPTAHITMLTGSNRAADMYWGKYIDIIHCDPYNMTSVENALKDKNNNMKFDVIVGNPPYQGSVINGGHGLWQQFVKQSLIWLKEPNGHLLLVTPKWIGLGLSDNLSNCCILLNNKGEEYIKNPTTDYSIFYKYQLDSLILFDSKKAKEYFNIGSSFCWYHIIKTPPIVPTKVIQYMNGKKIQFTHTFKVGELIPPNITPKLIKILNKIYRNGSTKIVITLETMKQAMETKNLLSETYSKKYPYKLYRGAKKISYISIKSKDYGKIKVLIPCTSEFKNAFIDVNCNQTHDLFYVTFDTMKEAETFLSFIKSDISVILRKIFTLGRKNFRKDAVPNINMPQLTPEEIKYIEDNHGNK